MSIYVFNMYILINSNVCPMCNVIYCHCGNFVSCKCFVVTVMQYMELF